MHCHPVSNGICIGFEHPELILMLADPKIRHLRNLAF